MDEIVYRNGLFWIEGDGSPFPLPPAHTWEGEAALIIRLRSTRGGNAARWMAGEQACKALNNAWFEPILRAVVSSFMWAPPNTRDCPRPWLDPSAACADEVYQLGSGVPNWIARVKEPLPDPVREWLGAVWAAHSHTEPWARQGGLEVRTLELEEEPPFPLPIGSGNRRWFNHWLIAHHGFVWRVLDVAVGLVEVGGQTAILSPDHPGEPLFPQWPEGLRLLLSHPIPQRGD